ncbi:PLP-dependent aminotransferase family protein [Nocardia sp. NPDC005998]|uniref:MocR-like pyridoxine biosynthesis transcription factor PdxR n=1 Tax=Nocardia sp. NPDC005998 TaxID=3156894 RepID=UPI0033A3FB71
MSEHWPNSGVDLHLELDATMGRQSGLENALRTAIRSGRLAAESRLPATRKLATELGLSRGTVRAAYDQLIAEGYLTARQGSGTTVARLPPHQQDPPGPDPVPDRIRHDLRPGGPDACAFPTTAWLRAARRALTSLPADIYRYDDPRGRIELRTALTEYLGRSRGVLAHPDHIVITNGYTQALALLTTALGENSTPTIAMEDPGADFHRAIARHHGAVIVPLPVDEHGARTDLLTNPEFTTIDAVEVTAAHQYPTGATLHPQRRQLLIAWARSRGGLIIENDYDGEFRYDRQPVGAIQGTAPDHVAYVGTVSKTLGPALRLGWIVTPPRLLEPVIEAKRHADRHTESLGQLTLTELITTHAYDRHIRASRLRYRRRRDLLLDCLRPWSTGPRSTLSIHGIAAGLKTLVRFDSSELTEHQTKRVTAEFDLAVGYLGDRWHTPGNHPQGIVLGYSTPPEHAYPAALEALTHTLRALHRTR